MLWVFDSGYGWLQTLKYLKELFPDFDYIFYADNKNVPYGTKTPEQIEKFTFQWLNYLFDHGAKLVILACNTASAYSIKKWQKLYPEKKVLSITIPWVEKVIEKWYKKVWVIATLATIISKIYDKKFEEISWKKIDFYPVPANTLVSLIENNVKDDFVINEVIKAYLEQLPQDIEALVLWCTHFPIYIDFFKKNFNKDIIDPAKESIYRLVEYFRKHKDIYDSISKNWKVKIIETGNKKIYL